jgi:2,4'-dihydroxyacetophenone dioxygenase
VYEPDGTLDAWRAIGDGPCVLHLKITGTIDYIGADGEVTGTVHAARQCKAYLDWCARRGTQPDQRILGGI